MIQSSYWLQWLHIKVKMFHFWLLSFCVGISLISPVSPANILFFFPLNSYSHRLVASPLAEALVNRGHNVTFISPHKPKHINRQILDIVPAKLEEHVAKELSGLDVNARVNGPRPQMLTTLFDYSFQACQVLYNSPEFESWLNSNPKIDLVIVDSCLTVECGVGLAHRLSAKYLVFGTTTVIPYEYDLYGYTSESSAIPELEVNPFTTPMGFYNRIVNAFMSIQWYFEYVQFSRRMDVLIREKLGESIPPSEELVRNASLVFYNGDSITDYPRSLPPNHINIGGIHCKKSSKPIPEDLQSFLNEGPQDGFVYISLGSGIDANRMPPAIKEAFFQVVKSFPSLKFLWKWDGEIPEFSPNNLLLRKWFPQSDILAHESIRAFLTQGGRPSIYEAVWNGVPMISFPIQGDQDFNVNRMVEHGVTIKLEIGSVTVEILKCSLEKVVHDSSMKHRMTKLKTLIRDRQNTPLETAIWWTEYVIRTPNTEHLRPAGHNQSWFVRRQIDVWIFLGSCFMSFSILVGFLLSKRLYTENLKVKND